MNALSSLWLSETKRAVRGLSVCWAVVVLWAASSLTVKRSCRPRASSKNRKSLTARGHHSVFSYPSEDSLWSQKYFNRSKSLFLSLMALFPNIKSHQSFMLRHLDVFSGISLEALGFSSNCMAFFVLSCNHSVVADLTLEERTCLNLLFNSCMLGDLGLARWSPPLLFSPFPPPRALITWNI